MPDSATRYCEANSLSGDEEPDEAVLNNMHAAARVLIEPLFETHEQVLGTVNTLASLVEFYSAQPFLAEFDEVVLHFRPFKYA